MLGREAARVTLTVRGQLDEAVRVVAVLLLAVVHLRVELAVFLVDEVLGARNDAGGEVGIFDIPLVRLVVVVVRVLVLLMVPVTSPNTACAMWMFTTAEESYSSR